MNAFFYRLFSMFATMLIAFGAQAQDIIFSDAPFADGDRKGKDKVFSLKEKIYGRLLVPKTVESGIYRHTLKRFGKSVFAKIRLNQMVEISNVNLFVPESDLKKPYLDFEILPSPEKISSIYFDDASDLSHLLLGLAELYEGTAELQLDITKNDDFEVYRGNLRVKVEGDDKEKLQKLFAEKIRPAMQTAFSASQSLPEPFKKKTAPFSDKDLSTENLKKMFKAVYKVDAVLAVGIDDNDNKDFIVQLNELGNPIKQYTARNIFIAYKTEGKCEFVRLRLEKAYLGGGKYGNLEFVLEDKAVQIGCDALK